MPTQQIPFADVCRALGIDPKVGRAKVRAMARERGIQIPRQAPYPATWVVTVGPRG